MAKYERRRSFSGGLQQVLMQNRPQTQKDRSESCGLWWTV